MIKSLLLYLRKQPKMVKDNVALGVAGVFTALVFSVWIYTAPARFSDPIVSDNNPDAFSTFTDLIDEQVAGISEALPTEVFTTTTTEVVEESVPVFATSTLPAPAATTSASATTEATSTTSQPRQIRIVTTPQSTTTNPE